MEADGGHQLQGFMAVSDKRTFVLANDNTVDKTEARELGFACTAVDLWRCWRNASYRLLRDTPANLFLCH